jgi:hypothetical protein
MTDLEKYRQMALDLWFSNGGSCTGATPEPKEIDDAIAEDEEFKRIENQQNKY